jgi:hypothetical protein
VPTTFAPPAPTLTTLGGVKSADCSSTGHVQKVNTDGSITCSADAGGGGGGGSWGSITGTLSDQTDLAAALAGKQPAITTGTTGQYFQGDLSLATFPTTWAWANLTGVPTTFAPINSGDWVGTWQSHAPSYFQPAITKGTTGQYFQGDLSLATFPTTWAWANLTGVPTTFAPPAPTLTTLGGVKSADCSSTGHVQKVNTDGSITCSADSGGGGSALTPDIWPLYTQVQTSASYVSAFSITAANSGQRFAVTVVAPGMSTTKGYLNVTTASTGGYGSVAIYSHDMSTILCHATPFSVGATGWLTFSWSSACNLSPGTYYGEVTADNTVAKYQGTIGNIAEANLMLTSVAGYDNAGCVSTGTGASLAFVVPQSCTWHGLNGSSNMIPFIELGN